MNRYLQTLQQLLNRNPARRIRRLRRGNIGAPTSTAEKLENRCLLATIIWDGEAGDNNWDTAANWFDQTNGQNDVKPGGSDDAVIAGFGGTTITSDLNQSVRSLTTDAALTVSAGTLAITDDSTIDSELLVTGAGILTLNTLTLSGTGNLTNQGTVRSSNGVMNTSLHNDGLFEGRLSGNQINGVLTTGSSSIIRLGGTGGGAGTLVVSNGFDNQGTIELTTLGFGFDANLVVTAGVLINSGTIHSIVGDGGGRTLSGAIDNQNSIIIDHTATIQNSSRVFDLTSGSLSIADGQLLTVDGGETIVGSGTVLSGSGTLRLAGTHALTLDSDATLLAGGPALDFSGSVTVGPAGRLLTNQSTLSLSGDTVNADLLNESILRVPGPGSVLNGALSTAIGSTIRIGATGGGAGNLKVASGFENLGTIELTELGFSGFDAVLEVVSGTLVNSGTIATRGANGPRTLRAVLDNDGTVSVNERPLAIYGSIVDTADGSLTIADGQTLTLDGGETIIGDGSLNGTGTMILNGTHALTLASDVTLPAGGPSLNLAGSVTVGPTGRLLTNQASLSMTADVIDSDLANEGVLSAAGPNSVINGTLTTSPTSTIRIGATGGGGGHLSVVNGFTNHGLLQLTELGFAGFDAIVETTNGALVNTGTIATAGTSGQRTIRAVLDNQGSLIVDVLPLRMDKASAAHANSGLINISSGRTLNIQGSGSLTQTGGSTIVNGTLQSAQTVQLQDGILGGTGNVAASVTQSGGSVSPGQSVGTLRITGDYVQSTDTGNLSVELGPTTADVDQLQVTSNVTLAGALNIASLGGFAPTADSSFIILNHPGSGTVTGTFTDLPEGSVFLGDGIYYEITYQGGADNNDVVLTVVAVDFGDAPDTYLTLQATDGPMHVISSDLYLGVGVPDEDTDGFGDGTEDIVDSASDDDLEGATPDDEDSVTAQIAVRGVVGSYSLDVTLANTTGESANLIGWIDFDRNGSFEPDEAATAVVPDGATTATLAWSNIGTTGPDYLRGNSFARLRFTTDAITTSDPGGTATDGEVEDYPVMICEDACWDGGPSGTGTDWNLAENWVGDVIPGASNDVFIDSGFTGITSSQNNSIRSLEIESPLTIDAGTFTITDDSTINADLLVTGTGTLTLNSLTLDGTATLNNQATVRSFGATLSADTDNFGVIRVAGGPGSVIDGQLTTDAGSVIRLEAIGHSASSVLSVASGFVNNGQIELWSDNPAWSDPSILNVAGTLTNATGAVIRSYGGSSPVHQLNATVVNHGAFELTKSLKLFNNGRTFENTDGQITVANGRTMEINGGITEFGTDTVLAGTGTINFTGTSTVNLQSDLTIASTAPAITLGGTVTINGPGKAVNQSELLLSGDTINADLENVGTLRVAGGPGSVINGQLTTESGSLIRLEAIGAGTSAVLSVGSSFMNDGQIELWSDNPAWSDPSIINVSGTLTNSATGSIRAYGGANPVHRINAVVDNQGAIVVEKSLQLSGASAAHSNSGTVTVVPNRTLSLTSNGTLTQTGGSTIVNGTLQSSQALQLQGGILGGTGNVAASVIQSGGSVSPGQSVGTLRVTGDFQQTADTGSLSIELGPATTDFDQLQVTGNVTLDCALSITSLGAFDPPVGTSFLILDHQGSGAVNGTFTDLPEGRIFVGGGVFYEITYQGGTDNNDVILTVVQLDFGDAPDAGQSGFTSDYPVTIAQDAARHAESGPQLGQHRDAEIDGTHSAAADFDDTDAAADDEDGVAFTSSTLIVSNAAATTCEVQVDLRNADPVSNRLNAWIDFNHDGDWDDADEQIFADFDLGVVDGVQSLNFTIPQDSGANVLTGTTFARFRISTAGGLLPTGPAIDGEVEDHPVTLLPCVRFESDSQSVNESAGTATVRFLLSTAADQEITIPFSVSGTAIEGTSDDFTISSSPLTISAGLTAADVVVTLNDENLVELTETVVVESGVPVNAILIGATEHTLSITDNDTATFSISNAGADEGGTIEFSVTVDQPLDTDVTILVSFIDVSATGGNVDYDSTARNVTFSAGTTSPQTVSVSLVDDIEVEGHETFTATLAITSPTGTRLIDSSDTGTGTITDNDVDTDFGDAPVGYPVTLADDGARHVATGPTLGSLRDAEIDGVPSAGADSDGPDDDGVEFSLPLILGRTNNLPVTASASGFVNAWVDLNDDGDFGDGGERILTNHAVAAGTNTVPVDIPDTAVPGDLVFRFRLTSESVAAPEPFGILPDGEVEDYLAAVGLDTPQLAALPGQTENQLPAVSWSTVPGAESYEVWLSSLTTGPNPLYLETTTTTSWTPPQPLGIGRYRVWVRATHAGGPSSEWSVPKTFHVNTRALLTPQDRFTTSLRPVISWESLNGAATYDLWIDSISEGTSQYVRQPSLVSTSWTPASDLEIGRYRIWVRGIDAAGQPATWSRFDELVIAAPPEVIGPVGGVFNRTPRFEWNAVPGAVTYEVLLRDRILLTQESWDGLTDTTWTPPAPLTGGPWSWHVLAVAADGERTYWSDATELDINGRPHVTSPTGSTGDTTPEFTWGEVIGAVRYDLWVDKVGGPVQIIREQNLTTNSFTPSTPLPTGDYRVWVRAISDTAEVSPWSILVEFAIVDAGDFWQSSASDILLTSVLSPLSTQGGEGQGAKIKTDPITSLPTEGREVQSQGDAVQSARSSFPAPTRVIRGPVKGATETAGNSGTHARRNETGTAGGACPILLDRTIDAAFSFWAERSLEDI